MSATDVLTQNGIKANADAIVTASVLTGVPLHIAAAFVQQESGGLNVFGNDKGGAMAGQGEVTPVKFARFLGLLLGGAVSNGVGPLQITYKGYFPQAALAGVDLSDPEQNMVFGLAIISGLLGGKYDDAGVNAAGQRYNSGSATGAPSYGKSVADRAKRWYALLNPPIPFVPLRLGDTGPRVLAFQTWARATQKSGVATDGDYGPYTAAVVAAQQRLRGLTPDGVLGPDTYKAMQKDGLVL